MANTLTWFKSQTTQNGLFSQGPSHSFPLELISLSLFSFFLEPISLSQRKPIVCFLWILAEIFYAATSKYRLYTLKKEKRFQAFLGYKINVCSIVFAIVNNTAKIVFVISGFQLSFFKTQSSIKRISTFFKKFEITLGSASYYAIISYSPL